MQAAYPNGGELLRETSRHAKALQDTRNIHIAYETKGYSAPESHLLSSFRTECALAHLAIQRDATFVSHMSDAAIEDVYILLCALESDKA